MLFTYVETVIKHQFRIAKPVLLALELQKSGIVQPKKF